MPTGLTLNPADGVLSGTLSENIEQETELAVVVDAAVVDAIDGAEARERRRLAVGRLDEDRQRAHHRGVVPRAAEVVPAVGARRALLDKRRVRLGTGDSERNNFECMVVQWPGHAKPNQQPTGAHIQAREAT